MNTVVIITKLTLRTGAVAAALLGIAFWSGRLLGLLPLHMMFGLLSVFSVWAFAVLVLIQRRSRWLALRLIASGLVVLILGLVQTRLFPGDGHWLVRLAHLIVGIGAVVLGERATAALLIPKPSANEAGGVRAGG